jgi:hypothetical protein
MVIQQSMATFFYHAFASIQPANHSDFFNTHSPLHQQSGTVPCEVREVSELVLNLPSKLGCFGVFSSTEECGKARWVKGFMLLTSKLGNKLLDSTKGQADDCPIKGARCE